MSQHRPWPEAGRDGAELADVRRELARLAEKRTEGSMTADDQRRYRQLARRESELTAH
jgi:hypothetical protein